MSIHRTRCSKHFTSFLFSKYRTWIEVRSGNRNKYVLMTFPFFNHGNDDDTHVMSSTQIFEPKAVLWRKATEPVRNFGSGGLANKPFHWRTSRHQRLVKRQKLRHSGFWSSPITKKDTFWPERRSPDEKNYIFNKFCKFYQAQLRGRGERLETEHGLEESGSWGQQRQYHVGRSCWRQSSSATDRATSTSSSCRSSRRSLREAATRTAVFPRVDVGGTTISSREAADALLGEPSPENGSKKFHTTRPKLKADALGPQFSLITPHFLLRSLM